MDLGCGGKLKGLMKVFFHICDDAEAEEVEITTLPTRLMNIFGLSTMLMTFEEGTYTYFC